MSQATFFLHSGISSKTKTMDTLKQVLKTWADIGKAGLCPARP